MTQAEFCKTQHWKELSDYAVRDLRLEPNWKSLLHQRVDETIQEEAVKKAAHEWISDW